MPTYLIEFFAPRAAAEQLPYADTDVRVIAISEDETVFWLAEAASLDELSASLAERGGEPERIVEADDIAAANDYYAQALAPLRLTMKMEFESARRTSGSRR